MNHEDEKRLQGIIDDVKNHAREGGLFNEDEVEFLIKCIADLEQAIDDRDEYE